MVFFSLVHHHSYGKRFFFFFEMIRWTMNKFMCMHWSLDIAHTYHPFRFLFEQLTTKEKIIHRRITCKCPTFKSSKFTNEREKQYHRFGWKLWRTKCKWLCWKLRMSCTTCSRNHIQQNPTNKMNSADFVIIKHHLDFCILFVIQIKDYYKWCTHFTPLLGQIRTEWETQEKIQN